MSGVETILCIIAQATDDVRPQYFGKYWRLLDAFSEHVEKLLSIEKEERLYLSKVREVASGELYLAITHTFDTFVQSAGIPQPLLPMLYKNYLPEAELEAVPTSATRQDDTQELRTKYITTRLYDLLSQAHEAAGAGQSEELELPLCFQPTLCRYQARAVQWMLRREKQPECLPSFYTQLLARDDQFWIYKHLYCQELRRQAPEPVALPPGGILADEMGLGKTVEVLALLLLHQRPDICDTPACIAPFCAEGVPAKQRRTEKLVFCVCGTKAGMYSQLVQCSKCGQYQHQACVGKHNAAHDEGMNEPYLCPNCWESLTLAAVPASLVQTRATLIVTPSAIKKQWQNELERHVQPPLRVLVYNGIVSGGWLSPRQLADYDVVLADYNVLRADVYHTAEFVSSRTTRNRPRFMRLATPLLMVHWWRVCLDEAQMVESNISKLTQLVHKLPAVNRWAVTGTPIQRSIDDLLALLIFIGFSAACEPAAAWHNLVHDFVLHHKETTGWQRPLVDNILRRCMWRSCKHKVEDELHIPPQTEEVHYIELSNLEKLFYNEQHKESEEKFNAAVKKHILDPDKALHISPLTMKLIMQPLLKLRQSCNIPVVVDGKQASANVHKQFLQPKELHAHLKSANELECKGELRSMASSYNGMAAIFFMRKDYDEAIRHYELMLKLAQDYQDTSYTVDSLLQIHALHNIMQAYHTSPKYAKEKLPYAQLAAYEEQCYALEWKYLEPAATTLSKSQRAAQAAYESYNTVVDQTESNLCGFLAAQLDQLSYARDNSADQLLDRIHSACVTLFADKPTIHELRSASGVLYIVNKWWKTLEKQLQAICEKFQELHFFTNNVRARNQVSSAVWRQIMQFTDSVYDCHLSEVREVTKGKGKEKDKAKSAAKEKKNHCQLCKLHDMLNAFECLLFHKVLDKETNLTDGLAIPSAEISLIKAVLAFMRSNKLTRNELVFIDTHIEALDCLQTLWKKWMKFWIEIEYTVKAYDELDMCKMRISLTDNEEEQNNHRVAVHELDDIFVEQQLNLIKAQQQFAVKLARLKYIIHLEGNADTGACPICHCDEETRFAVLECGHHLCLLCLNRLRQYGNLAKITCAVCRHKQSSQLYYVTRMCRQPQAEDIEVLGNYSAKITCVVRTILKLCAEQRQLPDTSPPKVLIFSQWQPILLAIRDALHENNIRYRHQCSQQTIEEFKNYELGITCLLMTYTQGSKGLNLTEANHVFLVEPVLNPGEVLQAIGRVHRIGQTRATAVHRFIVKGTIEENVYNVVSDGTKAQSGWEFDTTSLQNLRNLFKFSNAENINV